MIHNISSNDIINSLIPNWKIAKNNFIFSTYANNKEIPKYDTFTNYIINEFNKVNKENNLEDEEIPKETIDKIVKLHDFGLQIEFSLIKINKNDIIFPICDIGKNRSQFMFYYLKNLQDNHNNFFTTGYPTSGDELATILKDNNSSVLSGFQVPYKSDCFSVSLISLIGFEYSRSIHIFDKFLKEQQEYIHSDLRNLESYKFKNHKYDIYEKNRNDALFINDLFKKYFLNPNNIKKILGKETNNVIYLCLSPNSFINLLNLLYFVKENDKSINFANTKIIYFGFKDIFQRSSVNQTILNDLIKKINSSIVFIN